MNQRIAAAVGSGRASSGVFELAVKMGLPMALSELGMPESAIAEVAADVALDPPPNPRELNQAALAKILRAAWVGDVPR